MRALFCLAAVSAFSVAVFAAPIIEVEPNDDFGTAQVLPLDFFDGYGAGALHGALATGDVDFFRVHLDAGVFTTASVFDFTPGDPTDNDSYLGIFAPDGTLFDTDDDDGPGFLSSYAFFPPISGEWAFAVSGFGDTGFVGAHSEEFAYRLVLSIPEPASLALLGFGALALVRRR